MANINFYLNFLFFPNIKSFIAAPKTLSLSLLTQHQAKTLLKKVKLSNKCSTITLGFFFFSFWSQKGLLLGCWFKNIIIFNFSIWDYSNQYQVDNQIWKYLLLEQVDIFRWGPTQD